MRIGAFVLKEFQSTIVEKEEIERRAKQGEKAAANQAALKVSFHFILEETRHIALSF